MQPFTAVFTKNRVVVPSRSEADSLSNDGYGYWSEDNLLYLDKSEVLYNVERQKIVVIDERNNKKISFKELLISYNEKDPETWDRFLVFKDLRTRGFVIKKEPNNKGFLIWERGMYKRNPPDYRILIISEGIPRKLDEFFTIIKKSEEKSMETKLAVIDRRGEIVYYTLSEAFTRVSQES
jgi:tRNA-intron endonuclease